MTRRFIGTSKTIAFAFVIVAGTISAVTAENFYNATVYAPNIDQSQRTGTPRSTDGTQTKTTLTFHEVADSCPGQVQVVFPEFRNDRIVVTCVFTPSSEKKPVMLNTMWGFNKDENGKAVYLLSYWLFDDEKSIVTDPKALADFLIRIMSDNYRATKQQKSLKDAATQQSAPIQNQTPKWAENFDPAYARIWLPSHKKKKEVPTPLSLQDLVDLCPNKSVVTFPDDQGYPAVNFTCVLENNHYLSTLFSFNKVSGGADILILAQMLDYKENSIVKDPDKLADFVLSMITLKTQRERGPVHNSGD